MNNIFTYDAFDASGVAETFRIKVDRLVDSDEEYIGIADYVVLEGDLSLLSACQLLSMEEWLAWEYVKRWNESASGLACNNDPVLGGIIDKTIISGEWFVIFNDDNLEMIEGLSSREEAFKEFQKAIEAIYWIE